MKWAVEVQHTTLERRNLADLLAGLGFALIDGAQFPAFTSEEIDQCSTAKEAFEIAKRLRTALTGLTQIDPEFALGSVIDYTHSPERRHAFLEVHSAVHRMSVCNVTLTINPPTSLSAEAIKIWEANRAEQEYQAQLDRQRASLVPAYSEPLAGKVLQYLAAVDPSAEVLYKIYELLENHSSGRAAFHTQFGIPANEFDRFRDAVHNPTVSGDWARHAVHGAPRTPNPMSKTEAEEFVRRLADRWLKFIRASLPQ